MRPVPRNPALGRPRDIYLAFHRHQDIPFPVCVCTIWPNCPPSGWPYVEWIEVSSDERRRGIASEMLLGLQDYIGPMVAEPVTYAGQMLIAALGDRLLQPGIHNSKIGALIEAE